MRVIWKKVPEARSVLGQVDFVDEIPRNVVCLLLFSDSWTILARIAVVCGLQAWRSPLG